MGRAVRDRGRPVRTAGCDVRGAGVDILTRILVALVLGGLFGLAYGYGERHGVWWPAILAGGALAGVLFDSLTGSEARRP